MNSRFCKHTFVFLSFFILITCNVFASITVSFTTRSLDNNHFSFIASSTSSNTPVKYFWDFGDGDTQGWNTGVIANHTFQLTGHYNVKLVGENLIGERDSIVINILARNYSTGTTADFSYSAASVYLGDTVTFINTSTSTAGSATAEWWDFGDASSTVEENPVHIYMSPGIYSITLTSGNSGTGSDTTIKCVNVLPPNTDIKANFFFSPSPAFIGSQLQFTSISYTANGLITNWKWDFGDGSSVVTIQNPTHVFTDPGIYLIKLSITNSLGQTDTLIKAITVNSLQQETLFICPNATTDLYAAYSGNTYQWQESTDSGNTYHNISNNSYFWGVARYHLLVINPPTSWYGYKYRCVTDIGIGIENKLEFQNNHDNGSGAWEDLTSWSCGILPDANTDVVISSGTVIVNSNVVCRSLTILQGAAISVSPGYNLTVLH